MWGLRRKGSLENSKKTNTEEATLPMSRCHWGFFLVPSHHFNEKDPKEKLGGRKLL